MTSNRFPPGYIPLTIHELNGGIASLANGHSNGAERGGPRSHGRSNGGGGGGGGGEHRRGKPKRKNNNRPRGGGGGRRDQESFDEE